MDRCEFMDLVKPVCRNNPTEPFITIEVIGSYEILDIDLLSDRDLI